MGVHFSVDSSGILKVDKAESVIEVWEEYEVEVAVEPPAVADTAKQNGTTKARNTLEDDDADEREVRVIMTMAGTHQIEGPDHDVQTKLCLEQKDCQCTHLACAGKRFQSVICCQ